MPTKTKEEYRGENPILNNPYEEPKYYYDSDSYGNIDYDHVIKGRRPYGFEINMVPQGNSGSLFSQEEVANTNKNAEFINGIRDEVGKWRDAGYPKCTRITKELLDFWFNNESRQNQLKLFFCQREAIETAVYLNEIAERDPNMGMYILRELLERQHSVSTNDEDVLPRTAFKMATGTGKTVVMAMLILYNYLNKRANMQDTRFADHFLICAPGITIRDRLGVLQLDNSSRGNNFDRSDYYHQRGLIPQQFEKELGGLNSSITIVNYQQFLPRVFEGKHASPMDGKLVYRDGEMQVQKTKEDYSVMLNRVLEKGVKGKRLIVINDEAHHCYLPNPSKNEKLSMDEKGDIDNETAMVWYEGLRQMKKLGYKIQHVYDLSATPYYLQGSGYPAYSIFPWTVSDFGLVDAIESGLVKIPFLPAFDNATNDLDEPKLRNIYKYIREYLPKRGQRGQKKKDKEDNIDRSTLPVQAPNLPTLLNAALEQFVKDYEDYDRGLRGLFEASGDLYTAPPVMIVVCNNTTVSQEVFRYIAGYEDGANEDGSIIYRQGQFDVFSNYDGMGLPKAKFPTLLIDSASLENADSTIDEGFKHAYAEEIEAFKTEFVNQGKGNREDVTDADILREVVNTVGKQGKLGANIKCVVSVSMLTEGWDANTVTHVCGIRAFGSHLLCEQVVGRALRRQSYTLVPYDKDGNEIPHENVKRYKNITYKFPPEYARIIGVPFNSFKEGATVITKPQKAKYVIKALDERNALEMVFPNITGYRSENMEGKIEADFEGVPKYQLDLNKIPTETILQTIVNDSQQMLKTDYTEVRDQQVIYYYTQLMMREYYTTQEHGEQFYKFGDVKAIVEEWYEHQIEIIGGDGNLDQRRLVMLCEYKSVLSSINKGIHKANEDREKVTAILNYYNPENSTRYVHRPTNKRVYETQKSHVNYVVAPEESPQEIVAKELDKMKQVKCYVRNMKGCHLDFKVPYSVGDSQLTYKPVTYEPDFIVKVKTKDDREVNIVLEYSHFNNDQKGNEENKRYALRHYWLPAANNLGTYGVWDMLEVDDINSLQQLLTEKIKSL